MRKFSLILFILFFAIGLNAQDNDITLGSQYTGLQQRQGGFYDFSDPESINMRVSIWGFVKFPGRYLVPVYTSATDLLSYAGGPTANSDLEDLRLYRVMEDSTQHMFKFNFNDLLWTDDLEKVDRKIPKLQGSDLFVVPGAPRLYFRNWFRIFLSVFSALVSLTLLIIRYTK